MATPISLLVKPGNRDEALSRLERKPCQVVLGACSKWALTALGRLFQAFMPRARRLRSRTLVSRYMDLVQKDGFSAEIKVQRAGLVARMKSGEYASVRCSPRITPRLRIGSAVGWKPLFISTVAFTGTSPGGSMKRDPPYGQKHRWHRSVSPAAPSSLLERVAFVHPVARMKSGKCAFVHYFADYLRATSLT